MDVSSLVITGSINKDYDVNGLTKMQRDIFLRLCKIMWNKGDEIRSVIGMCGEHYLWKSHSFFMSERPKNVPATFRRNIQGGYVIERSRSRPSLSSMRCSYVNDDLRTLFLDREIKQGIFQWTLRIGYAETEIGSFFYVGSAPVDRLTYYDDYFLGGAGGSCSLHIWNTHNTPGASFNGLADDAIVHTTAVTDGSILAAELDADSRTLSFTLNGTKITDILSNVHVPCKLGVTSSQGSSFTSFSFRLLPRATSSPSPSAVRLHPCRPKKW